MLQRVYFHKDTLVMKSNSVYEHSQNIHAAIIGMFTC